MSKRRIHPGTGTVFASIATCALGAFAAGCSGASGEDVSSQAASATGQATPDGIADLALSNAGKGACSTNSRGGHGFATSCNGNGGSPEYWCADFARWVWSAAGVSDVSQLTAGAGSFYVYGEDHHTLSSTPEVGDAVVFDYQGGGYADHVALVTKVESNGTIETISGDWGGNGGSEAAFSSTSHVDLNTPAYAGKVGDKPSIMGMTISGFVKPVGLKPTPAPSPTPKPTAECGKLDSGHALTKGESVDSCSGGYSFVMQTDGNLVQYNGSHTALWASHTVGTGDRVNMQTDGNLVVYDAENKPVWASNTDGHAGAYFAVQPDSNIVVYGPAGKALWARFGL